LSLARYATVVVAFVAVSLGLLLPALSSRLDRAALRAAVAGGSLAAANTVLAYGLVLWSSRRSTNVFLGTVLGGMVGRMALMLAAVIAGVAWLGLPKVPLALALLSYFVVFLAFELVTVHRRTTTPGLVR
jgi:hypothetical protein